MQQIMPLLQTFKKTSPLNILLLWRKMNNVSVKNYFSYFVYCNKLIYVVPMRPLTPPLLFIYSPIIIDHLLANL